ncbi:hypothetical protein [Streptomyces sulphureus]|uniref:hypothetical protein n=1 Tax=Streptomyces sulphureus TaxID=47758 RepID=UPI000363E9E0|nr:hypothetical protein [Streptomyces sulphureus]
MRDLPRDQRPIDVVALRRADTSEHPERFLALLDAATAALRNGKDLATAWWSNADPVRVAAEIEALAGARRLNTFRKDPK